MILETILGKIKLYEKGQDKKWAELIEVKIHSKTQFGNNPPSQNIGNQYSDVSSGGKKFEKMKCMWNLDSSIKGKARQGKARQDCPKSWFYQGGVQFISMTNFVDLFEKTSK